MENLLDLMFTEVNGLPYPNLEIRHDTKIWSIIKRDGRKEKEVARREMAYIYFMAKKDIYSGFQRHQKHDKIRMKVGLPESWKPDQLVLDALEEVEEDIITKQDRLLKAAEELAEDFLELLAEIKKNNRRLIVFFSESFTELSPEQLEQRTAEIKAAKEELLKFNEIFKSIYDLITKIDALKAERVREEKKSKQHALSTLETKKDRYERRPEPEEDDDTE